MPGGSVLLGVLVIALLGYALMKPPDWLKGYELLAASLGVAFLLLLAVPVLARRPHVALVGLMTVMLAVVPVLAAHDIGTRRSLRDLAIEAGISDRPWSRVLAYRLSRPSLVFYGHRDVTIVGTPAALRQALDPDCLVVIDQPQFDELGSEWRNAFTIVAVQGQILAVAPISPLPSGGLTEPQEGEGSAGEPQREERAGTEPPSP